MKHNEAIKIIIDFRLETEINMQQIKQADNMTPSHQQIFSYFTPIINDTPKLLLFTVYINSEYIYIYIYIYVCVCVCVHKCVKLNVLIPEAPI